MRERKNRFRSKALERLKCRSRINGYIEDKRVLARLEEILRREHLREVMLYLPMKMEVDVRPLIRRLRRRGIAVYVPAMEGESFRLVKYRLPLRKRRFGIYEPKNSKQYRRKSIDLAIVPVVGVDRAGRRIGFGKGMYDRFFAREGKYIKKTLLVQRHLCWSPEVLTDTWDLRGEMLITGKGTTIIDPDSTQKNEKFSE